MVETKDLVQLRQLNLALLRQLWVGQDAVRRSVAKAASKSALDSSSSCDSQTPSSQETSLMALRASGLHPAHQGDPCDMSRPGGTSSGVIFLPSAKYRHQASLGSLRPYSAPLLAISDPNDPALSAELDSPGPQEVQAQSSTLDQQRRLSKSRVTLSEESALPDRSGRFWPYLGYDWIAGSLDNSSPITSKPEAFFSKLQDFREANKEECINSDPEPQFLGPWDSSGVEEDHECVYCYRVNRRLFLVPSDPGAPCRLCRTPRDEKRPETRVRTAQVRVSIPLSVLDPPHQYRIHRRKSFDASDTLALPRHCLLGWDILPPKSEKSSAPKSLDLWSCVSSEAQHRKLSAASTSHLALPTRVPPCTPVWSEPQPCAPWLKP
ncbi:migration and invasion-inhibitory protein isoform X1 [Leptonychotes weddellii]|uniref:Migration and invasion-inhibitory protein isoform X1 n=1 Tax=Leptonychotes weddellii TaxID=9713 RepID=A0A2U3XHW4_LEPWE|nr:migration and invasion-inhibitory protein isoform X1 [Leptonychotes weddellii]XP_030881255.1 migration and invasion-inhibitory protein isoform X1 [Leptonychotes weddellii]XP_030881258.1 migration and invasion-inhibitory protein isoform X1 [Leptonychotes weddellii]